MSDQAISTRERAGTAADRAPPPASLAKTAATGYAGTLVVATFDWILKCHVINTVNHHSYWQLVTPDNALIAGWAFLMMPAVHLIAKIIMKHLQRLAGEGQ